MKQFKWPPHRTALPPHVSRLIKYDLQARQIVISGLEQHRSTLWIVDDLINHLLDKNYKLLERVYEEGSKR